MSYTPHHADFTLPNNKFFYCGAGNGGLVLRGTVAL